MILASFSEAISIGAVLPFLGVLTKPDHIFLAPLAQPFIQTLGLTEPNQLLLPLTIVFGLATLMAGIMRLLLLWVSTRLSFAAVEELSNNIYRRTLYQPYSVHIARNSSEVIDGMTTKVNSVINNTVVPIVVLISSLVMISAILLVLIAIDPVIALISFCGFGFIYTVIIIFTRKRVLINSKRIALESTALIKSLQEGLGGIRDVIIDGNQSVYCQIYRSADHPLRLAQANNHFISLSPRYVIEALGMLLIATLAFLLTKQQDGMMKAIPVLGVLAVGAQRLLPVMQQAYASWISIKGGQASLQDIVELLDQPLPKDVDKLFVKKLPFKQHITLNQVSYRYGDESRWVLKNLNFVIPKGSRIGFIGKTGNGKSTLMDIIMGLLQPTKGGIEVDNQLINLNNQRSWQARIAHVPQVIFLADASIEENIAFGVPKQKIDRELIRQVSRQAQISDIVESWPKQYETFVGERGIRLSGGQRQRIGIARALYKRADVIIFDEATSALDGETEQEVMHAIDSLGLDLTVLIIAHRITTLRNCTQIVELSNGAIARSGTYKEIIGQSV
jgi:ATP-binding cassette subfamily B protein